MDDRPDTPDLPARSRTDFTVVCGMCKRRVPSEQVRTVSGRPLCFGCLASWYDEDGEGD
jgi:hypothetical protein